MAALINMLLRPVLIFQMSLMLMYPKEPISPVPDVTHAPTSSPISTPTPTEAPKKKAVFSYFSGMYILNESPSIDSSNNDYWWVSSGGQLLVANEKASTIQGDAAEGSRWNNAYSQSNPTDTDNGLHPQNIFRLVNKQSHKNVVQSVYFKINKDNLSDSPQRNESNGLLLFNRYIDENNLYYIGVRVDGGVVVKKKVNGGYTTLSYVKYFPGEYDRNSSANLLPKETWIGLKSEIYNNDSNETVIKVYLDENDTGVWRLVLESKDSTAELQNAGFGGIRTDFMDVEFSRYQVREINLP